MIPFNPLDKRNLGISVANAMMLMEPVPLAAVPNQPGAGIYAIYYAGDFEPYQLLSDLNSGPEGPQYPIYVGKAIPEGGRTGLGLSDGVETFTLRNRLRNHQRNAVAAENLNVDHFSLRLLTVEPIFIPLGETMLITQTGPVWNTVVPGFGSNAPGSGREGGKKSAWDTLHPGRSHSASLPSRTETPAHIAQEVREYLRSRHQV
ncbi:Eco29kI family restriction endonuclease [Arthrobacter sp. A5]|uniref:Eco29kI family restriction endonuclease n=1 Tax=Arthrobacter sp. A5 TaxID=576926 RepID=UPI003DA85327